MNRQLKQAVRLLKELRPQNPYVQNKLSVVIKLLTLPRKRPTKELPKELQSTKPQRSAAHRMSTAEIRDACMARSAYRCENCFSATAALNPLDLDHWLSGSGQRRPMQSVDTCWILCRRCHRERTANRPSAAFWNERFERHCWKHGYRFYAHVEKAALPRRGTA